MINFGKFKLWNSRIVCNHLRALKFSSEKRNTKMENLSGNPYFNKYEAKLKAFQKASPDEFLSRVASICAVKNLKDEDSGNKCLSFKDANAAKSIAKSIKHNKKLDDILKMELVQNKSAEEIIEIWTQFHKKPNKISAAIPASMYSLISRHAQLFPMFLYPIPRKQGYEFVVGEFNSHQCHFTSLLNYRTHKENAPELLHMTHYTELEPDKGIVLMNGEFDSSMLTCEEARFLVNLVQIYYASPADSVKHKLLSTFTTNPDQFQYTDLIKETELVSL